MMRGAEGGRRWVWEGRALYGVMRIRAAQASRRYLATGDRIKEADG